MKLLKLVHQFVFSRLRIVTHAEFTRYRFEITQLEQRYASLEQRYASLEQRYASLEQRHDLFVATVNEIRDGLVETTKLICRRVSHVYQKGGAPASMPRLTSALTFEQQLDALRLLEPNAFDEWWRCFLNGEREYQSNREGSLSCGVHDTATAFKKFVLPRLAGNVLDVGCGPQLLPSYLHGSVDDAGVQLFGIDPLLGEHPFEFFHGFAEFLPWPEGYFDTAIIATSLDHCLSLDKTLDELKRVLKQGGRLLIWVGFISGAKEYQPGTKELKALDDYHLFHFDRPWFEQLLAKHFSLSECIDNDGQNFFYIYIR